MAKKATGLLAYYHSPQDIFRALISMIEKENILLPDYTIIQDIISTAITQEESRLSTLLLNNFRKIFEQSCPTLFEKQKCFTC